MDDEEEEDDAVEEEWTCSRCTLLNSMTSMHCAACNKPMPDSLRPPDAVRRERLIGDDMEDMPYFTRPTGGGSPSSASSATSYLSGGALVGGLLGAATSYARGRPMASGALEGAMQGAIGGAMMNELFRETESPHQRQHQEYHDRMIRQQQQQQQDRQRMSELRSRQAQRDPTTSFTRTTVRRDTPGRRMTTTTTFTSSPQMMRAMQMGGGDLDPLTAMMMQSLLRRAGGPMGGSSVDGMSYEQLLSAFGDGSDMMGANEAQISQMPTTTVDESALPEDSRQCSICLEDFKSGDKRKILPCFHGFHQGCVDKWLRQNGACPICKFRIEGRNDGPGGEGSG